MRPIYLPVQQKPHIIHQPNEKRGTPDDVPEIADYNVAVSSLISKFETNSTPSPKKPSLTKSKSFSVKETQRAPRTNQTQDDVLHNKSEAEVEEIRRLGVRDLRRKFESENTQPSSPIRPEPRHEEKPSALENITRKRLEHFKRLTRKWERDLGDILRYLAESGDFDIYNVRLQDLELAINRDLLGMKVRAEEVEPPPEIVTPPKKTEVEPLSHVAKITSLYEIKSKEVAEEKPRSPLLTPKRLPWTSGRRTPQEKKLDEDVGQQESVVEEAKNEEITIEEPEAVQNGEATAESNEEPPSNLVDTEHLKSASLITSYFNSLSNVNSRNNETARSNEPKEPQQGLYEEATPEEDTKYSVTETALENEKEEPTIEHYDSSYEITPEDEREEPFNESGDTFNEVTPEVEQEEPSNESTKQYHESPQKNTEQHEEEEPLKEVEQEELSNESTTQYQETPHENIGEPEKEGPLNKVEQEEPSNESNTQYHESPHENNVEREKEELLNESAAQQYKSSNENPTEYETEESFNESTNKHDTTIEREFDKFYNEDLKPTGSEERLFEDYYRESVLEGSIPEETEEEIQVKYEQEAEEAKPAVVEYNQAKYEKDSTQAAQIAHVEDGDDDGLLQAANLQAEEADNQNRVTKDIVFAEELPQASEEYRDDTHQAKIEDHTAEEENVIVEEPQDLTHAQTAEDAAPPTREEITVEEITNGIIEEDKEASVLQQEEPLQGVDETDEVVRVDEIAPQMRYHNEQKDEEPSASTVGGSCLKKYIMDTTEFLNHEQTAWFPPTI